MKITDKIKEDGLIVLIIATLVLTAVLVMSCEKDYIAQESESELVLDDSDFEATDWTSSTHSKDADPDFTEVFDATQVKRIDIVISSDRWQAMLDNMSELYGTFGASSGGMGGPGVGGPGGPPAGGGLTETDEDPIFVPADIFYNGLQWYRVGVRFKGNSSLQSSWQQGNLKLSFKLDFDEFEDEYPQIDNQRFYGFKKLSLKNNYNDRSFVREKVAADIFARANLAVSHTAFYQVYVDTGNGAEYFGLYTLVEEVDNTVIKDQFINNDGNLYKPENNGASFASGSFNTTDFEKKTNEDEADWNDIKNLFEVLHANNRTTDASGWRANLDAIFDTDKYLKYLAVNTVIQNWDTYGRMTHNYYLYNNPENNKLTWIPWDNNEALQDGKMGGALNLDFSNMTDSWPLIEYIYADDVYKAKYAQYLNETIEVAFEENYIQGLYTQYSNIVEPYATTERAGYTFLNSPNDFQAAISELKQHVSSRKQAVLNYLGN